MIVDNRQKSPKTPLRAANEHVVASNFRGGDRRSPSAKEEPSRADVFWNYNFSDLGRATAGDIENSGGLCQASPRDLNIPRVGLGAVGLAWQGTARESWSHPQNTVGFETPFFFACMYVVENKTKLDVLQL